jgi:hypothetical protein
MLRLAHHQRAPARPGASPPAPLRGFKWPQLGQFQYSRGPRPWGPQRAGRSGHGKARPAARLDFKLRSGASHWQKPEDGARSWAAAAAGATQTPPDCRCAAASESPSSVPGPYATGPSRSDWASPRGDSEVASSAQLRVGGPDTSHTGGSDSESRTRPQPRLGSARKGKLASLQGPCGTCMNCGEVVLRVGNPFSS